MTATLTWGTPRAVGVLAATILGSGIAMMDSSIVNVALPAIGAELDASVSGLQWILDGYLLALASLILVAGSLSDRYGRRRVFLIGVVWFGAASLLCAVAWSTPALVAARVLQGIGGALLTPGSLAILQSMFVPDDRARAIGAWSGLGGVAAALGPFLGGVLVQVWSWRLAFLINVPVVLVCVWLTLRFVEESRDVESCAKLDLTGLVSGSVALAGITYALVEGAARGWTDPVVLGAGAAGVAAAAVFLVSQARGREPMVPPALFSNRTFTLSNLLTLVVYAALGGVFWLLVLQLQTSLGYSPVAAGLAGLPITVLMLLFSARSGKLAQRIGPRVQLIVGPLLLAAGMLLLTRVVPGAGYLWAVLPGVLVFGVGLTTMVAPVTATVLAAAPDRYSGTASGVNNAIARSGTLLAIAVLPLIAGIGGDDYADPQALTAGWQAALVACSVLAVLGAFAAVGIDNTALAAKPSQTTGPDGEAAEGAPSGPQVGECLCCGVEGPPTHIHQR